MQLKNNCTSNSPVIPRGKAKCNFDCYEYKYSLFASKCMWLPTNHIALPTWHFSLTLVGLLWVLTEASLSVLLFLYSSSMFIVAYNWYSSILKGYTVSKTSGLYSFQPKHVLLSHLSVTMHLNQFQCSVIPFTGYYIIAYYT